MGDNYFSIEETARVINLYSQSQNLLAMQIQQLSEQIIIQKQQIISFCNMVQDFLQLLNNLMPLKNEKLKKKSAKHQWIKLYFDKTKMQYWIHKDYCTYLIYHKQSIQNIQQDQQQYLNLITDFESIATNYISDINEQFAAKMLENNQNIQQQIQMDISQLELHQIIEILNDQDDILTEEEMKRLQLNIKQYMTDLIEKQYQIAADFINKNYKDFIQQSLIKSSNYPQTLNYDNFADGLETLKKIEKQIIIKEIDVGELNNLQSGLYHIKLKKKKMMIILEITNKQKQNAYIINQFQHYKDGSNIIEKLKTNFICYYIRTIKLKNIQEAYLICTYLRKKKILLKNQNQIKEIYQKEHFNEIDNEINIRINKYSDIQNQIQNFIQKFIPNSQNIKDIYSLKFVQRLQELKNYEFNRIEKIKFNQNLKSLEYQPQILGAVLEDQNKQTQGIVLYINKRTMFIFINNYQGNYQEGFDQESNNTVKIINTQVKEDIHSEVAQFYVSILLNIQKNNVSRLIKNFLQQKNQVWNSILKFLE